MKEPKKIKLTNNPSSQSVNLIPLSSNNRYDIDMTDDVWIKNDRSLEKIVENMNDTHISEPSRQHISY